MSENIKRGIAFFFIFAWIAGCGYVCEHFPILPPCQNVSEPTATPIVIFPENTPTPSPIPTFTPTPNDPMWGFVNGYASVLVEGLQHEPVNDKGSIFHLYHPTTGAWMNMRHRPDNKYQPKGAFDDNYSCVGEVNYFDMKHAGNGVWELEWGVENDLTWVLICSPDSEPCRVWMSGEDWSATQGVAAFREIRQGSADKNIPWDAGATITVLEIGGEVGTAKPCVE